MSSASRILVLDGIRGFALCLVLVQHFFGTRELIKEFNGFDRAVFGLVDSGWWAIDLFFVLSAFLITGILYSTKGGKRYFLDFYARRTLRIFPLYYAALLLFFIVLPRIPHPLAAAYVGDSLPDQAWFWTYLTNFRTAYNGAWYDHLVPTVFWSLAVEEQFYLIWPFVVRAFSHRTLIRICVSLFVVAFGVRVVLALVQASPIATFVLTPARMDCLAVGALLALIRRDEELFDRTARAALWVTPALILFLALLSLPHGKLDWRDPLTNTLGFSVTALMCGGILVLAVHAPSSARIRRLFEAHGLRMLGKYSYAMYIFHGPSATLVKEVYDFDRAPLILGSALPLTLVYVLLATLVTLAVGWLSWNLLESHFLKLQGRFHGSSRSDSHEIERSPKREESIIDYMHRRFSFSWLVNAVRERGLIRTVRAALPFFANLARLWWWDHSHRVSTRQRVFASSLGVRGPTAAHVRAYEASGTTVLPRVLRRLNIRYSDYVFLDLGAGKGQALFHAAELPFKRIVGLELSLAVYEIALKNCTTFKSTTQACFKIEILCGDAADFAFPDDPLVIYLFNSFDEVVLCRVLTNLSQSIKDHPRDVLLIYHNPQHRDVVEASGLFESVLTGTDERDFRKLGYEVFRRTRPRLAVEAAVPPVHPSREAQPLIRVVEVDPGSDSRWGAFVETHPDGLIYHHPLWLQVIENAYGHRPLCLACEGTDGSLHGVLPLFRTNGLLTGRRFSSLPHTPVGGPLARDHVATVAMLWEAMERVDREPGSWLQLKLPSVWDDGIGDGLVGIPGQMTYVLEMPEWLENLRFGNSRNHARIRWSVRKALKQNLEVRYAETDADLRAWYQLYLDTMRWHVVPPRPFRFFESAWNLLRPAGSMRLLLAEQRLAGSTRLVAGSILLMSGQTVFYAFNGWRRQDLGQRANDAIQWQAIHDACREGYRYYDLGEVEEHNQGLAEFKTKWGARPRQLYRYYYPAPKSIETQALASAHARAPILQAAWRCLPLRVTAVLGGQLYREL